MNKISFFDNDINSKLKNKLTLKKFIVSIFEQENKICKQIDFIFCTDEFLLNINNNMLQHNYYTDIITFDLSTNIETIAEIYISIDRVKDNCLQFKQAYINELHRVIFHGILHLCGYKDKSKKDITQMRSKEDFYLNHFFTIH